MPEADVAVRDALLDGTALLSQAACDTPRLDAELLLAHALGVDRARLVLDGRSELDRDRARSYEALLTRRREREPVAYILGMKGFRHLELRCDSRALIPRPETELLVEVGLLLARAAQVLDVGTGSGAVALALKAERPDLTLIGTDVSEAALSLARENASLLGLDVELVCADLRGGLACDAVLANLPYVAEGTELAPEISGYEPPGALFAGPDGLAAIRRLVADLDGVSVVALEHGFDQADAVAELLRSAGFGAVQRLRDLAGHERVAVGRRS